MNSDGENEVRRQHPPSQDELGCRISVVVRLYRTKKMAAESADVSVDQLARYQRGTSRPPIDVMARLCVPVNVSLDWLATGRGEMQPSQEGRKADDAERSANAFDEELHALVVDGIDAVYKEEGARLPPRDLGRLAIRIHGDLVAAYDDPDDRKVALKLALQSLRRDLRSAPTADGQSKRQA